MAAALFRSLTRCRISGVHATLAVGIGTAARRDSEESRGSVRCESIPWVPRQKNPAVLEILLVRHGESENNVIMRDVFAEHHALRSNEKAIERAWLAVRKDDPGLSATGLRQAKIFAMMYADDLKARGCIVYCSPFVRTLQTAQPLADVLQNSIVVRSDIFEVGGVYTVSPGGVRGGPGKCLSAQEVVSNFPGYDVSGLPAAGQWYTGGWETDAEARVRLASVARWLRSEGLRQELNGKIMVIVCHGHFIDNLMKALVGKDDNAASDSLLSNNFADRPCWFVAGNTATARLTIKANGNILIHSFNDDSHLRMAAVTSTGSSAIGG